MAQLVSAIDEAGAQLQLHDIAYPESRVGDDQFFAALQGSSGAVIAQIPALKSKAVDRRVGQITHPMAGVSCNLGTGGEYALASAQSFMASNSSLASIPKGHISAVIDSDGAVRRSPALVCIDGAAYPALSIAAFLQLGSADQWSGELSPGSSLLSPSANLSLAGYPGLEIPVDAHGTMRISFAKSPEAFLAVSAVDVMRGRVDPGLLQNAWVLVGGTAYGMADIVPTPYSGAAYGVELQARLLASILDDDVPFTPKGAPLFLLLICMVYGTVLWALAARGERVAFYGLPIAAVLMPFIAAVIHIIALASFSLWLGWIAPAMFSLFGASGLLLLELGRVRLERSRVFNNLNSYLPFEVAREVAFSLPSSTVSARRRDVTLLSADLRNFSAFSESRPPEEIAALLHFFFTRVTEIVEKQGGRVQEFRGDGILAIWDSANSESAHSALWAAQAMQLSLNDRLLPQHALKGFEPLGLGVGIEQGPVLIGSIGPAHRRSYTILGDTVSITLRIQEMTAEIAQPILLGECVSRHLSAYSLLSQGSYLLAGLQIPHVLFAPEVSASVPRMSKPQPRLTVMSGGKI
jgi:class 3 adenylate cyclase